MSRSPAPLATYVADLAAAEEASSGGWLATGSWRVCGGVYACWDAFRCEDLASASQFPAACTRASSNRMRAVKPSRLPSSTRAHGGVLQ